jgi:hypothetical protein
MIPSARKLYSFRDIPRKEPKFPNEFPNIYRISRRSFHGRNDGFPIKFYARKTDFVRQFPQNIYIRKRFFQTEEKPKVIESEVIQPIKNKVDSIFVVQTCDAS